MNMQLAVKVRVVAGVLKVDYLVSKRITNNKCVMTAKTPYRQPAMAKPYLLENTHHSVRAGITINLQGEVS